MQSYPFQQYQHKLTQIAQNNHISYLALFGSYARGEQRPDSDIDFLIDFDTTQSLFDLARVKIQFQELLGKKVDLAMKGNLKKKLEPYILRDLVTVYEKN